MWGGFGGIALWPFVFIDKKINGSHKAVLLNHERIHLRQQLELAIIFFYIAYLLNYIGNVFIYRNHKKAYRNIIFEREAYANDGDDRYLERRKRYAFFAVFMM